MTLRQYLIKNNTEDENIKNLFYEDFEAIYAESWDAEYFSLKIFKKPIKEVKFRDIYVAFRAVVETVRPVSYEDLENNYNTVSDGNKLKLGDGGYKKLNLQYDPNTYEPINSDEE